MERLSEIEIYQLNHTLKICVDSLKSLHEQYKSDIIDLLPNIQAMLEMNQNKILETHKKKFMYWQGKAGSWHTYLPQEGVKPPYGKQLKRASEEKLINGIMDYYMEIEKTRKEQKKKILTFNQVYQSWRVVKDNELGDESISKYNSDFRRFFEYEDFGEVSIDEITENTVKVYMYKIIEKLKLKKQPAKKLFGYIKNTIRHARIERLIIDDPIEFLTMKHFYKHCHDEEVAIEEKQYTDDDVKQMFALLKSEYHKQPDYMALYALELAIYTGMRVGELSALKWVDITDDSIFINSSEKYSSLTKKYTIGATKNGKPRHFPLNDNLRDLLDRIKAVYVKNDNLCEWIFAKNGERINKRALSSCNKNKWKQLGGKPKSGIHGYRHKLSSDLRTLGYSATMVADLMGHSVEVNNNFYNRNTAQMGEMRQMVQRAYDKLVA